MIHGTAVVANFDVTVNAAAQIYTLVFFKTFLSVLVNL